MLMLTFLDTLSSFKLRLLGSEALLYKIFQTPTEFSL